MSILQDLIQQIEDPTLRDRISGEVDRLTKSKKFGLVFERHLPECTPLFDMPVKVGSTVALKTGYVNEIYTVLSIDGNDVLCDRRETHEKETLQLDDIVVVAEFGDPIYPYLKPVDSVCNAPDSDLWHTLIEADNYHALQLLEYLYAGKVDCIYIDPPYNTGAKDWKYNNDYVDSSDAYRHSKWLSMMEKRLKLAKRLLNPEDSVLIVTIDEKEYLHLGCLLEEMFPEARMQMVTTVISAKGIVRPGQFARVEEYIFFIELGNSEVEQQEINMLDDGVKKASKREIEWLGFRRRAPQNIRESRPNQFYPIFVYKESGQIHSIGEPIAPEVDRTSIQPPNGCIALWPLNRDGEERLWSLTPEPARANLEKGYLKVKNWNKTKLTGTVYYLPSGTIKDIETGQATIEGFNDDGSVLAFYKTTGSTPPKRVWNMKSHNAETYGTNLNKSFIRSQKFTYPKSLYAVYDALRFFVGKKPSALIVDFFAGSGTTLHAVNLINATDDGHRRCILVTNNEVSEAEAEELSKQNYKPGDEEWERHGIARSITWPRTVCSIKGRNPEGEALTGHYGVETETYEIDDDDQLISKQTGKALKRSPYRKMKRQTYPQLNSISKADGFKANAVYFKLGFLDKTTVALGHQFSELLPLLWLKAGAVNKCPELEAEELPQMLILPENHFAVLLDEKVYMDFTHELEQHPDIQTAYIVTDSEPAYRTMITDLDVKDTYQLYRDYLDNFRINIGRNA